MGWICDIGLPKNQSWKHDVFFSLAKMANGHRRGVSVGRMDGKEEQGIVGSLLPGLLYSRFKIPGNFPTYTRRSGGCIVLGCGHICMLIVSSCSE